MPVVLYDIPQRITMIQRAAGAEPANHWDREMDLDNADFRIYKGVDNKIEFLIRNTDRKAVPLMGRTVQIVFADRHTGEILSSPFATVVDEHKGKATLTLLKNSTEHWPEGAICYSALVTDSEGVQTLLFVDHIQRATAYCYVVRSPVEAPPLEGTQVYNFPLLDGNEVSIRRIQLVKDGVGLDTTGYDFQMQIRTARSPSADVLQTLTILNGDITVVEEGDNVFLELRIGDFPGVTTRINAFYDLLAIKDDESTVWLEGTIPIEPGVTY